MIVPGGRPRRRRGDEASTGVRKFAASWETARPNSRRGTPARRRIKLPSAAPRLQPALRPLQSGRGGRRWETKSTRTLRKTATATPRHPAQQSEKTNNLTRSKDSAQKPRSGLVQRAAYAVGPQGVDRRGPACFSDRRHVGGGACAATLCGPDRLFQDAGDQLFPHALSPPLSQPVKTNRPTSVPLFSYSADLQNKGLLPFRLFQLDETSWPAERALTIRPVGPRRHRMTWCYAFAFPKRAARV